MEPGTGHAEWSPSGWNMTRLFPTWVLTRENTVLLNRCLARSATVRFDGKRCRRAGGVATNADSAMLSVSVSKTWPLGNALSNTALHSLRKGGQSGRASQFLSFAALEKVDTIVASS